MKEKLNMKDIWYGVLHVIVAMSSILFVTGTTGINLPLAFLTVGIGTLLFHFITKNKLAVLMGVSGSFIGGMVMVNQLYGPEYVAGGVVISGILYLVIGAFVRLKPSLYNKFPKYILNAAVLLIALNLLPLGANMAKGNIFISAATIGIGFFIYAKGGRFSSWAFPMALLSGTILSALTGGVTVVNEVPKLALLRPAFNLSSFTLIGVIALAVAFEALGDTQNCANAQGIELEGKDFGRVLLGNGTASTMSGILGGPPLTTYSENIGFIYLTGYKRPMAQIFSSIIFIIMAFVPGIGVIISWIPNYVYGAMLMLLFALIAVNSIKSLFLNKEKGQVMMIMLAAFYLIPSDVFSPIAGAILFGVVFDRLLLKRKR